MDIYQCSERIRYYGCLFSGIGDPGGFFYISVFLQSSKMFQFYMLKRYLDVIETIFLTYVSIYN